MRLVIQRVKRASVKVNSQIIGKINIGLLIFLAVYHEDIESDVKRAAQKVSRLRIFEDNAGKMNKSVLEIGGEILVISQFTLYGDCTKGNRPSFIQSARPDKADKLYRYFIEQMRITGLNVQTGKFQTYMEVELINDGPVTLIVDTR